MARTMKHNGWNPNRGFKQITGVVHRAHKFFKRAPEYLRKADGWVGKGADVLTKAGKIASMVGAVTGHEGAMNADNKMIQTAGSIQNYRNKAHHLAAVSQGIMGGI